MPAGSGADSAGGAGRGPRIFSHAGDLQRRPHTARPRVSRRWRLPHVSRHVMPPDTTHGITPQATAQVTSPRVPGSTAAGPAPASGGHLPLPGRAFGPCPPPVAGGMG
ncbi:Hypothetical protein AA314_00967 [Archangium gephyra]|uniref:Uncharacterized protein n=1 Tax=Archangium gephyra TaxID=48 RepID=A0AAC8TCF9_9BACT|nr:Hypothetical protein AA314_00967 [Archangium gephyra]